MLDARRRFTEAASTAIEELHLWQAARTGMLDNFDEATREFEVIAS